MISTSALLLAATLLVGSSPPTLRLPWVFSDGAVLQRDQALPVWGHAAQRAEVVVTFAGHEARTKAASDGTWRVDLPPLSASIEGRALRVEAGLESIVIRDLLVGEVWLCAGQSNMDFPLRKAIGGEDAAGEELPLLRLCDRNGVIGGGRMRLTAEQLQRLTPGSFYDGGWKRCDTISALPFSAVGFFFGQKLAAELDVPIGLIDVSVGGSSTEGWLPIDRLRADPALAPLAEDYLSSHLSHEFIREHTLFQLGDWVDAGRPDPRPRHFFEPGFLWEEAIANLAPFGVRGVLWYQGESNAHLPRLADRLFRELVRSWRCEWDRGDLPFCFVQLPGMGRPTWPDFREMQAGWLEIPATAMAVSIDVGHPTNVHPRDKREVGERLCLAALRSVYGRDVEASGPTFRQAHSEGTRLVIELDHAKGLAWVRGNEGLGWEIAASDLQYHPARARIVGESVELEANEVSKPIAARYAWAPHPICSLVNDAGLPAAPFRTPAVERVHLQPGNQRHPGLEDKRRRFHR
jgi:sialate O-acetylesterase